METFVVRVFVPADGAELELAGIVEHVGSETEQRFRGDAGLLKAVHRGLRSAACAPDPDGRGKERSVDQ